MVSGTVEKGGGHSGFWKSREENGAQMVVWKERGGADIVEKKRGIEGSTAVL